jgi:hypothetical protein
MEFSEAVFRLDHDILTLGLGENDACFGGETLETGIKKIISDAKFSENTPLADERDPSCPVFVVTTFARIADGPLKLFRSYGFNRDKTPIWQAGRATSATTGFFPPASSPIPLVGILTVE